MGGSQSVFSEQELSDYQVYSFFSLNSLSMKFYEYNEIMICLTFVAIFRKLNNGTCTFVRNYFI